MTISKGLATIGGCAMGGGLIGGLLGCLIGVLLPGAYRGMFRHGEESFNSVHVGIGLGVPQGMMFGAVVGILLIAIVAWYEVRTRSGIGGDQVQSDQG